MKIFYKEFDSLEELNEYVRLTVETQDVISINYFDCRHCMYFWQ